EKTGAKVVAITMGPPMASVMMHELYAMDVDETVLMTGREVGGSDTYGTSTVLATMIRNIGLEQEDVIFCGRQAIDGDTAQVGPQIAEKLHLPQVSYAAEITKEDDGLLIKRMLEDGYMMIKVKTPCLITCVKELNEPRYMSVQGIEDCFDKEIRILSYEDLKDHPLIDKTTIGLQGSPTNIYKSFTPPQKSAGRMLKGNAQETAAELAKCLAEKHLI
ncbi:MAG: electron transfer flavoprotein subunit beta/FixA family protein, partial [Solobacterium sp.]|nr:electron transfer flavoprotein subunit beta/FixA family protein [Solobacterium sp.]